MMADNFIPLEIKRFILVSIDSIPHLETILFFRSNPKIEWNVKMAAEQLFISEKKAAEILTTLCENGILKIAADNHYQYYPASEKVGDLINQLSDVYARNIVEISKLIHSKIDKQAQRFGDGFKWQNKEE